MLIELANHNDDIRRLLDKGYALRFDSKCLVVRDIPYLDSELQLCWGAFLAKLVFVDDVRVQQDNHQVYFAGSQPYGLNGRPIPNLAGGPVKIPLAKTDVQIERSFSNKPSNGFADHFAKIEHYVNVIAGPAIEKYGVTPLTFRVDHDVVEDSVFKVHDTLTSLAEIGDLVTPLRKDVIAIIGLGGTGSYLLDFMVKTAVKEIRTFDADAYHIHNAFRSPGELARDDLGQPKVEVYKRRYDNFRTGLVPNQQFVGAHSADLFQGVTFAFVCVDKGSARKEIFELLIGLGIPFIDLGLGLDRKQGPLSGTLRATYYSAEDAREMVNRNLAELADLPDDAYRQNVQISELNAMNACLGIMRYKQLRGFYADDTKPNHLLFNIPTQRMFIESFK